MNATHETGLQQQLIDQQQQQQVDVWMDDEEQDISQREEHQQEEEEHPSVEPIDNDDNNDDEGSDSASTTMPPSHFLTTSIFYLLGIGLLVPWNAFVSAKPYFTERLCGSATVELWFGLVYNASSVVSLGVLLFAVSVTATMSSWCRGCFRRQQQQPSTTTTTTTTTVTNTTESGAENAVSAAPKAAVDVSTYWMVMIPLSIYLSVFFLTALLVFVPLLEGIFLIVTLLSLSICGAMVAIASAGMVATASSLGDGIGPLFAGQAVGGVVVSAVNFGMAAIWESPDDYWETTCSGNATTSNSSDGHDAVSEGDASNHQALVVVEQLQECKPYDTVDWAVVSYFGLGCILLAACLVGYHYLHQLSSSSRSYEPIQDVDQQEISSVEASPRFVADLDVEHQHHHRHQHRHQHENNVTLRVWKKIRKPATSIFLNFVVTLAIFPAWTASLKSTHQCTAHSSRIWNDLYTPLTFLWFNVFDLIGRLLAERYSYRLPKDNLIAYACSRFIFFLPFLLLPSNRTTRLTSIPSDVLSLVVQAAFALSNGFVLSWSFLVAPTLIQKQERLQVIRSSEILNFALALGLLSGSLLSFVYSVVAASD